MTEIDCVRGRRRADDEHDDGAHGDEKNFRSSLCLCGRDSLCTRYVNIALVSRRYLALLAHNNNSPRRIIFQLFSGLPQTRAQACVKADRSPLANWLARLASRAQVSEP